MDHPTTWMEASQRDREAQKVVNAQINKTSFIPHPHPTNPSPSSPPLKIQNLTYAKMEKC
jgi:hypothetical protein